MYNSQEIAAVIKKTAKERNITVKQLLENCNLNINTISELSKGKQISYVNFAVIADNLGVSVDYLLGRIDEPKNSINISDNHQNSINGNNNIRVGAIPNGTQDDFIAEFLKRFEKLDFDDKLEIMNLTSQKLKRSA